MKMGVGWFRAGSRLVILAWCVFWAVATSLLRWLWRRLGWASRNGRGPVSRVAVIGGGIAGCGAAWACARAGKTVTLYEARDELGGNAKTFTWESEGVTTGLSVLAWPAHLFHNYCRLLRELSIESVPVRLPFLVHDADADAAFVHGRRTEQHERFARDIRRWSRLVHIIRRVNGVLAWTSTPSLYDMSLLNPFNILPLSWCARGMGVSRAFWDQMVVPIYSSTFLTTKLDYVPAVIAPTMCDIITLEEDPKLWSWAGDSRDVFRALTAGCTVRTGCPANSVERLPSSGGVLVTDREGRCDRFDAVIFACDARAACGALAGKTALESLLLGSVSYTDDNDESMLEGCIHSDASIIASEHREEVLQRCSNYIRVFRGGRRQQPKQSGGYIYENTFVLSSWYPSVADARSGGRAHSAEEEEEGAKRGEGGAQGDHEDTRHGHGRGSAGKATVPAKISSAPTKPRRRQGTKISKEKKVPMLVTYNAQRPIGKVRGRLSNAQSHPQLNMGNLAISQLLRLVQGNGSVW